MSERKDGGAAFPAFDPERPCKKCGHHNASSRWESWPPHVGDCILRACCRCGYAWREAPLDTQEDQS